MIPFVVTRLGDEPGTGQWVLAVDPEAERVLLVNQLDGKTLEWVPMRDCQFARAATPDNPTLVLPVQPQPNSNKIVVPNRAMRRNGG